MKIKLPGTDGKAESYSLIGEPLPVKKPRHDFNRVAFAAAHVVADPFSNADPSGSPAIDWDKTLAYRSYLLDLGFGIAEAMDLRLITLDNDGSGGPGAVAVSSDCELITPAELAKALQQPCTGPRLIEIRVA